MEQLGPQWTDFYEIWYLNSFRKSVQKIQVSLQSGKNNGLFTWRPMYMCDIFLEWEMFQTKIVEKIKTHFMFNNFFFPKIVLFMR